MARKRSAQWTKRRWGYVVWGVALATVFIPEILAAWNDVDRHLPFITISGMTGHIEFRWPIFEVVPTMLIVFVLVSILRLPPHRHSGGTQRRDDNTMPYRTAGGRITFNHTGDVEQNSSIFDQEGVPVAFIGVTLATFVLIALATWLAAEYWDDGPRTPGVENVRFHPSYVLYGSIALLWIAAPSIYAVARGKDAPFPTLFRTVLNGEDWLRRRWPVAAWVFAFAIVWGLVFLLIHLTLYPFPDITKILNPNGG